MSQLMVHVTERCENIYEAFGTRPVRGAVYHIMQEVAALDRIVIIAKGSAATGTVDELISRSGRET